MHCELLQLSFRLAGCRSLKDKRRRVGRLREKFGRLANVAVCESAHHDNHTRAEWSFVAIGQNADVVRQTLDEIVRWSDQFLDAEVVDVQRERIAYTFGS